MGVLLERRPCKLAPLRLVILRSVFGSGRHARLDRLGTQDVFHARQQEVAMAQEHKQPRKSHDEEEPADGAAAPAEAASERKEKLDDDIDAILEDIDDVLETNAEDFVKSFIQKGGQ
jgi:ubiquitin-like protein Pup